MATFPRPGLGAAPLSTVAISGGSFLDSADLNAEGTITLGAATASATGALLVKGALTKTLSGVTFLSEGTLTPLIFGALTTSGVAARQRGIGAYPLSSAPISGYFERRLEFIRLDSATISASGTALITGAAAVTLATATLSSQGILRSAGQLTVTLANATAGVIGDTDRRRISGFARAAASISALSRAAGAIRARASAGW